MDQLFVNIPSSIHAPPQTPLPLLNHPNPSWNTVLDQDEYDDDLPDLPPSCPKKDKQIRRRSSKACDQCRKSKCKCERPGARDEPCKNCVLLGTPCTFLGPSRKRGPPKGYIDAIESRLHQMEALLGTLISSPDPRARSLIDDLTGDPLARDILARVDESPFGTRGKTGDGFEDRASRIVRTSVNATGQGPLPFASPSTEWQEHLKERLKIGVQGMNVETEGALTGPPRLSLVTDLRRSSRVSLNSSNAIEIERDLAGQSPRQRRRLDSSSPHSHPRHTRPTPSLSPASASSSDDEELASAVGQLSLNEDSQVRYHGQVSGLHILGQSDRLDKRNEGGIWRFPRAGVWPRAARRDRDRVRVAAEWDARARLPDKEVQKDLLDLYFAYVHPVLPVMQKKQFWCDFRGEPDPDWKGSPSPPRSDPEHASSDLNPDTDPGSAGNSAQFGNGENRVPTLLLLAMFAIAARYKLTGDVPLPPEGDMWNAGDEYLEDAKRILNQTYASSRPSTCQALLLLSYREIGIGAMAQAWLYVGMAVRMAQDLGMHRFADKWQRTGAELFSETERQVRKRIWFSCVIMDKYVSTYIGRPLSIFERDFDTPHPAEDPAEEMELWHRHTSAGPGEVMPEVEMPSSYVPVPTRLISCFNASARLSGILSNIVETIYAVHPPPTHSRHTESILLEKRLDKWYFELPEHLQFDSSTKAMPPPPPPHILTLHMQYWCSVLLVHRPFMRRKSQQGIGVICPSENDAEANASCRKAFDLCAMAATKISNIVMAYKENFCLRRSPAFLTYYVFSASIMHMTTLSVRPIDVQAGLGLQRCMDALQTMNVLWPSAGRAWELLHGAKIDMREVELSRQAQRRQNKQDKRKRISEENDGEINKEPRERSDVAQGATPVASLGFVDTSLDMDIRSDVLEESQSRAQVQPPSQTHQFNLGLDTSSAPANTFQEFERWSAHDGFSYPSGLSSDMNLAPFVDPSNFDSPKGDIWKDFPEQFADPSLITSSLYGLPVMSGPIQGQTPPFLGDFSMYNMQPASGSNSQ